MVLTPLYVKTLVSSGLGDSLACAEVCHDALVDLARQEAFEAADDLAFGPAIGSAAGDVVTGGLVESHADDDGSKEGGVGLPVAAAIDRRQRNRAFQLLTLSEPNKDFEDRATQIDLRFSKSVPLGRNARLRGKADFYNVLNRSAVARQNFVYGPAYGLPTEVMGGRLFKFGATLEF